MSLKSDILFVLGLLALSSASTCTAAMFPLTRYKESSSQQLLQIGVLHAAKQGDLFLMLYLERKGARICQNEEPFDRAVSGKHLALVEYMIDHGCQRFIPNKLCLASAEGQANIVRLFLSYNFISDIAKQMAMCYACVAGQLEIVRLLSNSGMNVRFSNDTPLYIAVAHNRTDIVEFLLDQGAMFSRTNNSLE